MKERGLFRSAVAALPGEKIRLAFAERKAKKEMALYEAHFASPKVAKFYDQTIDRAMAHKMNPSAMALSHIQTLDAASLREWRHNQVSWDNQPDAVKAVFEIALTIAQAEKKRKARRGVVIAVGEGQDLMIPEDDAFKGDLSEKPFGMSNPDTAVVGELYKLLGLDKAIENIPTIPGYSRFFHTDNYRFHVLNDYGVRLRFSFSGPSAGEFGDGAREPGDVIKVPFYPAHIGMTVEAKKTLVK